MSNRAAIYARISSDDATSTSVAGQVAACEKLAASKGWQVTDTFVDRNVSGGRKVAQRPGLSALLDAAEGGVVDAVCVYSIDRLARSTGVFAELADRLQDAGAPVAVVREAIDLSTPEGRLMGELLAVLASFERTLITARVESARERHMADGRFYAAGVPFGWKVAAKSDGPGVVLALDPEPAEKLQAIAALVIGGQSVPAAVRAIDPSINSDSVRRLFRSPIVAGHSVLRGTVLTGVDGLPRVVHEPLLPPAERHALLAALDTRAAGDRPDGLGDVRLLNALSIVRCGVCGSAMALNRSRRRRAAGSFVNVVYNCRRSCVAIKADALEEFVSGSFLDAVGHFAVVERDSFADDATADAAAALLEVSARRESIAQLVAEGLLPIDDARSQLAVLAATAAEHEVNAVPHVADTDAGETYADRWCRSTVDERKRMLAAALVAVVVHKGQPGRRPAPADRVVLVWAE